MKEVIKTTPCGEIKGIENERCLEFRGIRYATAARYEMPVEVTNWEGTYDATAFGACCYQHRAFEEDAVVNPFYHIEFRKGVPFTYSEDCLFLNIWAPKNAENCPVLVFIHGGSFTGVGALSTLLSGDAKAYHESAVRRFELLKDEELQDVKLDDFDVKPYLLYFDDITQDPTDWRNEDISTFYGKNSVVLK